MQNLARSYKAEGRLAKAISIDQLANACFQTGLYERAESVLVGLVRAQRAILPTDSRTSAARLVGLSEAQLHQGKFGEVEGPLRDALETLENPSKQSTAFRSPPAGALRESSDFLELFL